MDNSSLALQIGTYFWGTVIPVLLPVLIAYAIKYVKKQIDSLKNQDAKELLTDLVAAADQLIPGSGKGADKKKYVIEAAEEAKVKVTDAQIEAAVNRQKTNCNIS